MSFKTKSVSDKLLEIINPTAVQFDPEGDIHTETAAKVVDNDYDEELSDDDDEALSQFRKQNVELIEDTDKRYIGKKVTRKSIGIAVQRSDEEDISGDESRNGDEIEGSDEELSGSVAGSDDDSEGGEDLSGIEVDDDDDDDDDGGGDGDDDDEDDGGGDGDDDDEENYSISQSQPSEEVSSFEHLSTKNLGAEVNKGNAIRHQLGLWDNLLECRIQLQKCIAAANRLPQPEVIPEFMCQGGSEFNSAMDLTRKSVRKVLDKLIDLRSMRLQSFSETKSIGQGRTEAPESDEEIKSSSDGEEKEEEKEEEKIEPKKKKMKLEEYSVLIGAQHEEFIEYRNATIQKWNDKTRVSAGSVSSRGDFSAFEQSTVRQIEQIMTNRQRLVGRTQVKRSALKILGKSVSTAPVESKTEAEDETMEDKVKEIDKEIFDDSDFYHQLLRELIERKSGEVTDPQKLGKQWLNLQKIRSKMKRTVDRRASKGRRLRYNVHPKLVSFMAPIDDGPWNEEAKAELYSSLFGQNS